MKRILYLVALLLSILTAIGYVVGKNWEKEAQKVEAEMSFGEKITMWKQRAKKGEPEYQYKLASYYDDVRKNYLDAQKWYRVAATKGQHAGAQYRLGQLYMTGRGVENDLSSAMQWFRKAASLGDVRGQFFLGIAERDGWERKPDFIEAYKWFYLSNRDAELVRKEDYRYDPVVSLAELEKVMSQFNIERAVERAKNWKPVGK